MRKPVLTIFYQFNPWHTSIGGIQTVIRSCIKYAPSDFVVRLVGTGQPDQKIGVWQEGEFAGRSLQFFPLIGIKDDNIRGLIPTTIKYTAAMLGRSFASDFMHFHRLEPSVAALNWSGEKTLFLHNDIEKQMNPTVGENTILWKHFPAGYFALENLLIKQFAQIYSCNSESANFYQKRYPELAQRVTFLKNTVDNEIFYPLNPQEKEEKRKALAQKLNLPQTTRFLLFAGRLHPQKDPLLLVRTIAALQEPDVHLLIAGDGELKGEVQSEVDKLGLTGRVTLLGSVIQEQLADLHRLASIFMLTSVFEGLPLVVLEALSCGTPVVTTPAGETPKLLTKDSGLVCEQRTPEAIAATLQEILRHPQAYPTSSCVRAAQPFSARSVVTDVYATMLEHWQQNLPVSTIPQYVK